MSSRAQFCGAAEPGLRSTALRPNPITPGAVTEFFHVDLNALKRFTTSLEESGQNMDVALRAMRSASAETPELDEAAQDFQRTWQYGLGQLQERIKATTDGVHQAHEKYRETEQSVVDRLAHVDEQGG